MGFLSYWTLRCAYDFLFSFSFGQHLFLGYLHLDEMHKQIVC